MRKRRTRLSSFSLKRRRRKALRKGKSRRKLQLGTALTSSSLNLSRSTTNP
jgi:hypothetical protein